MQEGKPGLSAPAKRVTKRKSKPIQNLLEQNKLARALLRRELRRRKLLRKLPRRDLDLQSLQANRLQVPPQPEGMDLLQGSLQQQDSVEEAEASRWKPWQFRTR